MNIVLSAQSTQRVFIQTQKSMERVSAESDVTLKYVSYICVLFTTKMDQGRESNTNKNLK